MPKIPGVPHLQAVRALEKVGFRIVREGKHIVMSDGRRILTILATTPSMPTPWAVSLRTLALQLRRSGSSSEGPAGPSNDQMQDERGGRVEGWRGGPVGLALAVSAVSGFVPV